MAESHLQTFLLDSVSGLELIHVEAEPVTYQGRPAVRLIEQGEPGCAIAVLSASDFMDGVIETEIAGMPRRDAPQDMRGFVGIAFRVQPHGSRFECIFLRPTNGRADDQLRRNHSTQYISHPDYPWFRLREESPAVYESYTDLVPGAWTPVKIVVSGQRAELYVNHAEQPCLIVNDLKLGVTRGQIALWIGAGTEAYFSPLKVKRDG
ncbi:MAG TPA: hypothetical protein VK888_10400 [Anaerolineales bacterium]|nr:hypothetical protein [Anaerolineales bacterium]